MPSYRNTGSRTLSDAHRRMLYDESGIDPDVTAERGVRAITRGRELPEGFSRRQRDRGGGILFDVHRPNGKTAYSFRPDATDPNNPGHRYEQPCKALGAAGNVLDVHPSLHDLIGNTSAPVIFCEGIKKADSITSAARREGVRVLVVAITGVWNWMADGEAIADMFDIPLEGRRVTICFDSDMLRNPLVQLAARRLSEHLIGRGAEVFITYLPDHGDGSKMGADDFLAAGGTLAELRMLTRRYDPSGADFALVRLNRDERLAAMIADLTASFWATEWKGQGGHTDRDTALILIRGAAEVGRPVEGGVSVPKSWADLQTEVKVGPRTVSKSIRRLEEMGLILERVKGKTPDKRGGFVLKATPRAGVYQTGTGRGPEQQATLVLHSLYAATIHPRSPRLMWSSPGSRPRRGTVKGTRKVRQSPPSKPKAAVRRPGKIRGAILDVLDAIERAGGTLTVGELSDVLHRKRPRDLTRRKRPGSKGRDGLAIMLIDAGIVSLEGEAISLTADWSERLDDLRRAGREIDSRVVLTLTDGSRKEHVVEGAETIARRRLEIKRRGYREHLDRRRSRHQETSKASRENVRRSREKRRAYLDVDVDDPAANTRTDAELVAMRGRIERRVREGMARRFAEQEVYGGTVSCTTRSDPPTGPPDDPMKHPLACECLACSARAPSYARAFGGAA